jgi:hypothetical protein
MASRNVPAHPQRELSSESGQIREAFARYGRAMFFAQCVEKQVAILLASTFKPDFLASTPDERDAYFDVEFRKTLGKLILSLGSAVPVPSALEGRLRRAVHLRNWLAHEYFWDRSLEGMSFGGRADMIKELDEAAEFLRSVDEELTGVSIAWLVRQGVPAELIEAEVATIKGAADARDAPRGSGPQ